MADYLHTDAVRYEHRTRAALDAWLASADRLLDELDHPQPHPVEEVDAA